jgi:DNA-binding SARP family transcriptional activator/tetratricopeptide (TPR) repeat protein
MGWPCICYASGIIEACGGGNVVRFWVLGPVRAADGDRQLALPGRLRRALLAYLLLNRDRSVSVGQLVEGLWGATPPATAKAQLQAGVSALRRALRGPANAAEPLVTELDGYRAAVQTADLDLARFSELVAHGRRTHGEGRDAEAVEALRAALAEWRGPALLGAVAAFVEPARARLADQRVGVLEDLFDLELQQGRQAVVLPELHAAVEADPLRERLCGLLMLALHRTGRTADALAVHRALRERLADELGIDPGRELAELAQAILRADSALDLAVGAKPAARPATGRGSAPPHPTPPRPTQLPGDGGYFTGRTHELSLLDRALAGGAGRLAVITGPGGAGKTTLAVRWAHAHRDDYPDGHLYLDLHGHERVTARSVADALGFLLRSLGTPPDQLPAEVEERSAAYRSLIADRRMIIVLDNAAGAGQVEPLLPATSGSAVLVTSRQRLDSLVVRHQVNRLPLEMLPRSESIRLIAAVVGAERVVAEHAAVDRLAQLCGDLPLALRIVAARLVAHPGLLLDRLADELADARIRLSGLTVGGDTAEGDIGVRVAFASSYRNLDPSAAHTFRMLSQHPGAVLTAAQVAALTGRPYAQAGRDLAELATGHLVIEAGPGRYQLHDLVLLYAAELAEAEDTEQRRTEAYDRLVDWYLAGLATANQLIMPHRKRVTPALRFDLPQTPQPDTEQAALDWFDLERENIGAIIRATADRGADEHVYQLAYLFNGYLDRRGLWASEVESLQLAARAAARLPDQSAEGCVLLFLGVACGAALRHEEAMRHLARSHELLATTGDQRDQRMALAALGNLSNVQQQMARYPAAIETLTRVIAGQHALHDQRGEGIGQLNLGHLHQSIGEPLMAIEAFNGAIALSQQFGDDRVRADALVGIAEAQLRVGDLTAAAGYLAEATEAAQQTGSKATEARAATLSSEARQRSGDRPGALALLRHARQLYAETSARHEEAAVQTTIGSVLLEAGELEAARSQLRDAAAMRWTIPDPLEEARLEHAFGDLANLTGDPAAAHEHWARADARYAQVPTARARELRGRLPVATCRQGSAIDKTGCQATAGIDILGLPGP